MGAANAGFYGEGGGMTTPKLTPTQIKALKAAEAGDLINSAINGWIADNGVKVSPGTLKKLCDLDLMKKPRSNTVAYITAEGRLLLADIKDAEAAKEAAAHAKPLSTAEIDALESADKYDRLLCIVSGSWSDFNGYGSSFASVTINRLVARGLLKKLDADTVKLTDAGRDVLAKIKEAANG
jgi:hypothetical protein